MTARNCTIDTDETPASVVIHVATALGIEIALGLVTNSFVVLYSFCHPTSLKKSANLLLLNLSIVNLLYCLLVLPFPIINVGLRQKCPLLELPVLQSVLCNLCGYLFKVLNNLLVYIIAAISIDRYIFITRPFQYRRYMRPKLVVTSVILLWIFIGAMSSVPLYGFGTYEYNEILYLCSANRNQPYAIYTLILYTVPIIVTVITTVWTTLFTRMFLRKRRTRLASITQMRSLSYSMEQLNTNSVYSRQIINLFGLFSLLLIIQGISVIPGVLLITINANKPDVVPDIVLRITFILYNTNCIGNPIIQAYFRKDLNEYVCKIFKKLRRLGCSVTRAYNHSTRHFATLSVHPMRCTIVLVDFHQHGADTV